jgi:hypothetical protein
MNDDKQLIGIGDLYACRVSLFTTCRSKWPPKIVPLSFVLHEIVSGRWGAEIILVRNAADKSEADRAKVSHLPAIKVSGEFKGLCAESLIEHSGLLCLDVDGAKQADLATLRDTLKKDAYVVSFFASPSGLGLKVIVAVNATDPATHVACFELAQAHFMPLLPANTTLDSKPSNIASNCFASFDPKLWRATTPRKVFRTTACGSAGSGCDIDISHVIESNEKEPLLPSSSTGMVQNSGSRASFNPPTPPPPGFPLPPGAESLWANWGNRAHKAACRNEEIAKRVPILNNLLTPELVARFLLRWYDLAPKDLFKDSRTEHWAQTWSAINGCLANWANNNTRKAILSKTEHEAYARLLDDRQRATFRISRSLSLVAENRATRTFALSAGHLGDRLDCGCESASRQLEYLVRRECIELVSPGKVWAPGVKSSATRYRWLLTQPELCSATK